MIIKNSIKVQLPYTFKQITHIYPAYDNTFVILGLNGLKNCSITHVDVNGGILFEYDELVVMHMIGMISDKEIIFL